MLNPYLSKATTGYKQTQDLYENLIIENIQISGQNYYYIPRTLSSRFDPIFGEDVLSSFDSYAEIEMYLSDFNGYSGENVMLSKFGLEVRDTASFMISMKRYQDVIVPILPPDRNEAYKYRACEGDLIYAPFSQSLYEIKFVDDESPGFYQINKKHVWILRCELFQMNNDKFNTGQDFVDSNFNKNVDRLSFAFLTEDGDKLLTEDGGILMDESFIIGASSDDMLGYGDNNDIKKEFMNIINFSSNNPFSETF